MNTTRGLQCCADRHLWASGLELAIYNKLCALTWVKSRQEHGEYHSTITLLAEFFGVLRPSASRAVSNLIGKGWLEVVERKDENKSGHALKVEMLRPKDLRPVTHDQWVKAKGEAHCYKCLPMPWDAEQKDKLAVALYRESKGNVKWYPNMMQSLRKTGATDSEIEKAYHDYVAGLEREPKKARGWQSQAFRFITLFVEERRAA